MPTTTGEVYDIDFIQNLNWCQIALKIPGDGFVGVLRDCRLLAPLELAMQLAIPATVEYDESQPRRISRVTIERNAMPPGQNLHVVVKLEIDEANGKCIATVLSSDGNTRDVFTRDSRLESILVTAFREDWKIGYLSFDPATGEVSRGKLNKFDQ